MSSRNFTPVGSCVFCLAAVATVVIGSYTVHIPVLCMPGVIAMCI